MCVFSCLAGNVVFAESLIKNGADVNAKNEYGETPLHLAASNEYDNMVEFLIKNGADINAKTERGNTPLQYAARGG